MNRILLRGALIALATMVAVSIFAATTANVEVAVMEWGGPAIAFGSVAAVIVLSVAWAMNSPSYLQNREAYNKARRAAIEAERQAYETERQNQYATVANARKFLGTRRHRFDPGRVIAA